MTSSRRVTLAASFVAVLFGLSTTSVQAQSGVDGFNPGASGSVYALAVQPDGKILVGGTFDRLGGGTGTTLRSRIGRLNADGSLDATFNPGANAQVNAIAVQPDGRILVGGSFTMLGSGGAGTVTRTRIGRLEPDGSLDTTFNAGANGAVKAIAVQPDGKILVGGDFTSLDTGGTGATGRACIGRFNADGTVDAGFNPGANSSVNAIVVQPDGKILVGGDFTTLGGGGTGTPPRFRIGRLDINGLVDTFNPGANDQVFAIAVQPDGKVVVGGYFTTLGNGGSGTVPRNRIGRLDSSGLLDATFDPGANDAVRATLARPDGKLLVAGSFTTLGGGGTGTTPRNRIGRLLPNGSIDAFDPGANNNILATVVQPNGQILVGGDFTALGGGGTGTTTRNRIGRLYPVDDVGQFGVDRPPVTHRHMAVFVIDFPDTPPAVRATFPPIAQLRDILFNPNGRVATYFHDMSYGAFTLDGDVFGYFLAPNPGFVDGHIVELEGILPGLSVTVPGFDINQYDGVILVSVHELGLAGARASTAPFLTFTVNGSPIAAGGVFSPFMFGTGCGCSSDPMNYIIPTGPNASLEGTSTIAITRFERTFAHELTHYVGIFAHANSRTNSSSYDYEPEVAGNYLDIPSRTLLNLEYGNDFDVMGQSFYGTSLNSVFRDYLGWTKDGSTNVRYSIKGYNQYTVTISPIDSSGGVRAIEVRVPNDLSDYDPSTQRKNKGYFLEVRSGSDPWDNMLLHPQLQGNNAGIMVLKTDGFDSRLLDTSPSPNIPFFGQTVPDIRDVVLKPGMVYQNSQVRFSNVVNNGEGSFTVDIEVKGAITLSPPNPLPSGTLGVAYPGATITQSGGTAPVTFAVTSGALPSGLTLSSGGVLGGTPTAAGTFPFTVTATDAGLVTGYHAYTLIIAPGVPTVVTGTATNVGPFGATVNGTVNPKGGSTTAVFQYGQTTSYGSQVAVSPAPGSGTSPVAVSAVIAGLACGTPYHFRAVATNTGGTTNGADATFTTSVCPVLTLVTPNSGAQGQANLNVVITGAFTHFVQGTTVASVGAGITVNSTTVQSATQATANVTIAAGAALGARTVTVTTSGEVVSLAGGFTVTAGAPALTLVSPSGARRGRTNLIVSLTGQATHFVQGTTAANFGAGITVTSTTVQSATQATASVTVAGGAALGPRTVTITTGGEVVALTSGFVVASLTQTRGDFDGDSRADVTVFRPSNGTWYVVPSAGGAAYGSAWGNSADKPVVGDFDGDGRTDIAVFRPSNGTWYVVPSSTGASYGYAWGNSADIPVPGDYDGDGRTDIAVFRPSSGTWYIVPSSTGIPYGFAWGNGADIPTPGDYDGDGKTDISIYRPSTGNWHIVPSSTGVPTQVNWGNSADRPVPADYDGDGKADVAVFRPSNGTWYIVPSTGAAPYGYAWGNGADTSVLADFDGDGRADIAVFRPSNGTWYIVPSTGAAPYGIPWGNGADIPILRRP